MPKNIKIVVADHKEEGFRPHFWIEADAVVRERTKLLPQDDTMAVIAISTDGDISDAQCSSILSLAVAAMLNYKITVGDLYCHGITWQEILRRG